MREVLDFGKRWANRHPPIPIFPPFITSQSAWYRMENGAKIRKWKKIGRKIENGPRPEMGKKWPQNGKKNRKMTPNPIFSPFWGHFFPISSRGPFSIFRPIFPIFGFWPVFHSIPGGLTRNPFNLGRAPNFWLLFFAGFLGPSDFGNHHSSCFLISETLQALTSSNTEVRF